MKNKIIHLILLLPYVLGLIGTVDSLRLPIVLLLAVSSLAYIVFSKKVFGNLVNQNKIITYAIGLVYSFVCISLIFVLSNYPGASLIVLASTLLSFGVLIYYSKYKLDTVKFPTQSYLLASIYVLGMFYFVLGF